MFIYRKITYGGCQRNKEGYRYYSSRMAFLLQFSNYDAKVCDFSASFVISINQSGKMHLLLVLTQADWKQRFAIFIRYELL